VVVDILNSLLGRNHPSFTLDSFRREYSLTFDEIEVAKRRDKTVSQVLAEYEAAYTQTVALLPQIPVEVRHKKGISPWDGSPYDLEDFIIYSLYGHKQEHSAQIATFRQNLAHRAAKRNAATRAAQLNQVFALAPTLKTNSGTKVAARNGYQGVRVY
jgi:hypothetical protein